MIAPLPPNESLRLQALHRLQILDTGFEAVFDRITDLAAHLYQTEIATISLIDMNRQWFKSCVGLKTRETPREYAFCAHAILQDDVLVVPNTLEDERFCDNPLVTGPPYIRFYAGAPLITSDGYSLGTLCIIDSSPRTAYAVDRKPLRDLSAITIQLMENRLIAEQLRDAERAMRKMESGFQALVAEIPQILFQLDPAGNWTFLNPAWSDLTGYSLPHTLGNHWLDSLYPGDHDRARAFFETLAAAPGHARETLRFFHREGRLMHVEVCARSIWNRESGLTAIAGMLYDITERSVRERALLEAKSEAERETAQLAAAKRAADEANQRLRSMFWQDKSN